MKLNIFQGIIIIIFLTILSYSFFTQEIEAPKKEEFRQEETNAIQIIKNEQIINEEKYLIVNRSVIVPQNTTSNKKIVLLTIDDGPTKRTKEIIEILKKHNAYAIFFVNGILEKNNKGIIEEIYKNGFSVGNHTWSHLNLKKNLDNDTIKKEILKNSELIKNLTGENPKFFRAPYGESNASIRNIVKENGMIFMDWSGSAMDWDKSTIEKDIFINNVMRNIHSGSIILIHEYPWSLANLDDLLNTLGKEGYTYINPKNIIE